MTKPGTSKRLAALVAAGFAGVCLASCANTLPSVGLPSGSIFSSSPDPAAKKFANGGYAMSDAEQKLDCRKLTGRMQIRILEIRDHVQRTGGSALSAAFQSVVKPMFGGTEKKMDSNQQYVRDRAMLVAYNNQLKAKKCKSFDLDAELQPKNFRESPRPR